MHTQSYQLIGIIGHPLGHTLSPVMHTAAFENLQLPYKFGVLDVTDEFLPALISSLRKCEIAGANVTVPYKQRVVPFLDELNEDASALNAVNTIVCREGRLLGFNTDSIGLQRTFEPVKEKIRNASVFILGAGGAARAALHAIAKGFAPGLVRVYNRTAARGTAVVAEFTKLFPRIRHECVTDTRTLQSVVSESSLIVNTTSVGMAPNVGAAPLSPDIRFSNQQIIVDIIYNPIETALLRRARSDGAQTINGVEMFVQQGAKSFELWTGKVFPIDLARQVVTQALKSA
jgi:shikimate dehydrogenase